MELVQEIEIVPAGSRFHRADLHIHSYGPDGSYDVTDSQMTPENIVDTAVKEGLSIVSITDHNSIGNVERGIKYSSAKGVLLLPGVELSTPQGHLLVYLPAWHELRTFYGKLDITSDRTACGQTFVQVLELAASFGGFGILAHIDLESGFEHMNPNFNSFKRSVILSPGLIALEIAKKDAQAWYTASDDNANRKNLSEQRRSQRGLPADYELAKVLSSDAHGLQQLGKNAAGNRKLTRFKLETLDFNAVRIALLDGSARTRIEDVIPNDIPRFVGIKIEGGFLSSQVVHFSKNLTCIIGGRGSGKSTLLNSLRVGSANPLRSDDVVDSAVWPDRISLIYQDEIGRQQTFVRNKFGETFNVSDPEDGLAFVPIESYGQGDTAERIQHCDKDPGILLDFLDSFVDLGALKREDEQLRVQLLENQTLIERLSIETKTIADVQKAKKNVDAQLRVLKEQEAHAIVELEEKLANGRAFRERLIDELNGIVEAVRSSVSGRSLIAEVLELDGSSLPVGKEQFEEVKTSLKELNRKLENFSADIKKECASSVQAIKMQLTKWSTGENETQRRIDAIRKELEAKGIKLNLPFIRKVTKDASDYGAKLEDLRRKETLLRRYHGDRAAMVSARRKLKERTYQTRIGYARILEQNLRNTIVEFQVSVKYRQTWRA